MKRRFGYLFLIALMNCMVIEAHAQLNIKIGYGAHWTNPESHNAIYSQFNSDRPWLDAELKELKFLQGLQLGLRYRTEYNTAFELTWANSFKRNIATGTDPSDNNNFYRRVSYNLNEVGLGLEYIFGSVGLGASINMDLLKTGVRRADGANTRNLSSETAYSSTLFLTFHSGKSGVLSAALRPFIKVPWTSFDFSSLDQELNGTSSGLETKEDLMTLGISLIFFNGN